MVTWPEVVVAITSAIGTTALVATLGFLLWNQSSLRKQLAILQKESEWSLRPWVRLVDVDFVEAGQAVSTKAVNLVGMAVRDHPRFMFEFRNVGRTPAIDSGYKVSILHGDKLIAALDPARASTIVPGDEWKAVVGVPVMPDRGELTLKGVVAYQGPSELHELFFDVTFDCSSHVVTGFNVTAAT